MRLWTDPGPDTGWSWVVATSCWLVQLCTNGLLRSQGVIYVAVIDTLGVSRQEASWPFSVCIASACFAGLLVGFLTQVLSVRQMMFVTASLVTFGYILCYLVPFTIFWMTLAYGVIVGAGTGLVTPSLALVTNQYFQNARASANGISLAGVTCGAFIYPSCVNYLLPLFGLRGTFLVLGTVPLHIFIGASLLRPRTSRNFPDIDNKITNQPLNVSLLHEEQTPSTRDNAFVRALRLLKDTMCLPMFYLVAFSGLSSVLVLMIFSMIVADFATDVGIRGDKSAMLLAAFSLPDLIGRLGTGWLSDKKLLRRKFVFALAKSLSGVVLLAFPFVRGDAPFLGCCAILGALEGSATILVNVLFVEYMGLKKLTMALSVWSFSIGVVFLLAPPTIGLFRDYWGSYDSVFYLMGGISIASGLIWSIEPCLIRQKREVQHQRTIL